MTGMMGCGKSAVGKRLAEKTGRPYIDLDEAIEKRAGKQITRIFEEKGEVAFRRMERDMLKDAAARGGMVVSTGGGIVLDAENVRLMRETGVVVYLYRPLADIAADVDIQKRPVLRGDIRNLEKVFRERKDTYEQSCTHKLRNDGTVEEAVEGLIALLQL